MRSFTLIALILTTSCSGETSVPTQQERLYFWVYGVDEQVPTDFNPGRRPASAIELGEALRACGSPDFELVEHDIFFGQEVSVPSSVNDVQLVNCVRKRVSWGFNASREQPSRWRKGERGKPPVEPDGS